MRFFVSLKSLLGGEYFAARLARILHFMYFHMFAQAVGLRKLSRAHLTRIHHFLDNFPFHFHTMNLGVTFESVGARKSHATRFTLERFRARMHKLVSF